MIRRHDSSDSMPYSQRRRGKSRLEFDDANQHLWAIAYSDLLMVLMSFFIIFFSFSNNVDVKHVAPLNDILVSFKGKVESTGQDGPQAPQPFAQQAPSNSPTTHTGVIPGPSSYWTKVLQESGIPADVTPLKKGVIINFHHDLFGPGRYDLTDESRKQLLPIFELLRPHADKIVMTFIGHTDDLPINRLRGSVIDTNLSLSGLRASKAVKFAIEYGFNPRQTFALGVGQHSRNSRSLSLKITDLEDPW